MKQTYSPISSDLCISESRGLMTAPEYHTHNIYEIFYLTRGEVRFYVEHSCFHLVPGNIILLNPLESHRAELIDPTVYTRFALNVSHKFMETHQSPQTDLISRLFGRPFSRPVIIAATHEQQEELTPLFEKIWETYHTDAFGKEILCASYMMQILVALNTLLIGQGEITVPNTMPVLVRQTLQYINEHLPNHISLIELSKELYHNSVYLSRRFKEITGFSIQEYILRKRIYLAQNYLLKGYSVSDCIIKSGFGDHSNFTRTFTKYVGCSPKQYQKNNRTGP